MTHDKAIMTIEYKGEVFSLIKNKNYSRKNNVHNEKYNVVISSKDGKWFNIYNCNRKSDFTVENIAKYC